MSVMENEHFQVHINDFEGCNILACFAKKGDELLPLMPQITAVPRHQTQDA